MSTEVENHRLHIPGPLGDYFVFTKLNKGGMADVYLALSMSDPSSWVALKLLRPQLDGKKKFIEMFLSEGRLGQLLTHPNIARTLDVGHAERTDGPMYYLAMEYVHGRDLGAVARYFRKGGTRMPVGQALYIVEQVLQGLGWAHELCDEAGMPLHLVNRDVSPANIMVAFDGAVKLIDFGIAQATLDYRSQIGSIKGKIRYMSPEQVRGLAVDARSDLFSLAVVLYQLVTGADPFPGESDFDRMERIRTALIRPPSELNRHVGAELEQILFRALAKEPAERYASAEAMLEDIRRVRAREARPYSPGDLREFMDKVFRTDRELLGSKVARGASIVQTAPDQLMPIWRGQCGVAGTPTASEVRALVEAPLVREMASWAAAEEIAEITGEGALPPDPSAVSSELSMSIDVSLGESPGELSPSPAPAAEREGEALPRSGPPIWARLTLVGLGVMILVLAVVLLVRVLGKA